MPRRSEEAQLRHDRVDDRRPNRQLAKRRAYLLRSRNRIELLGLELSAIGQQNEFRSGRLPACNGIRKRE